MNRLRIVAIFFCVSALLALLNFYADSPIAPFSFVRLLPSIRASTTPASAAPQIRSAFETELRRSSLYVTSKSTPVWSSPSSKSVRLRTLATGQHISILEVQRNPEGNPWGKTANNTWVFMGNLTQASPANVLPRTGAHLTVTKNLPLRTTPEAQANVVRRIVPVNTPVNVTTTFFNDRGSPWGVISDGALLVLMDNLRRGTFQAFSQTTPKQADAQFGWATNNLTTVLTPGPSNLLRRISGAGCHAASLAIVLENLELRTVLRHYDLRNGQTMQLHPDPYTVTMLNALYRLSGNNEKIFLADTTRRIDANQRLGFDPAYIYANETVKAFGAARTVIRLSGDSAAKKRTIGTALQDNPQGIIIYMTNGQPRTILDQEGKEMNNPAFNQHFLVVSRYDASTNQLWVADPADSVANPFVRLEDCSSNRRYLLGKGDLTNVSLMYIIAKAR